MDQTTNNIIQPQEDNSVKYQMNKNVVVLSSSPRRGGNSDLLCDQFEKGAREAGHHAEKIFNPKKEFNDADAQIRKQ